MIKKIFSIFAAILFAGSMMASEITIAHTSATTVNMDGTNQAALFSDGTSALSTSVWSIVGAKNDASNYPGLNKDKTVRLYSSNKEGSTEGSALTISLTGGTINSVSVNINASKGTEFSVLVGGSAATKTGDLYTINAASFSLKVETEKGTTAVWINDITINFKMDGEQDVDATGIALDKSTLTLEQYREETLVATLTPSNATTAVVWESSDEDVASVSKGVVAALTIGTSTITASAGAGISDNCAVTVTAPTVLTCEQAAEKAATVANNNDKYPGGRYVVEGYAISMNTANGFIWLADDKDAAQGTFEVYQPTNKSEIADVAKGDKIRAWGYISKYNTNYEFLSGCTFEKVTSTAIDNTVADENVVKTIENGQLIIIKNGVKYNAQGTQIR